MPDRTPEFVPGAHQHVSRLMPDGLPDAAVTNRNKIVAPVYAAEKEPYTSRRAGEARRLRFPDRVHPRAGPAEDWSFQASAGSPPAWPGYR
jgi:hypothetical protein